MAQIFPFNNNILRRLLNWKHQQQQQHEHKQHNGTSDDSITNKISKEERTSSSNGIDEHFRRSAKNRMSMPIMTNQTRMRRQSYTPVQRNVNGITDGGAHFFEAQSLGHIYLQHRGETKQANLPNELTAIDTIRALFVCAFPNMLTMDYMSQPHVKIYIYNPSCNIFYELVNIEDVKHESVLRLHHSEPVIPLAPQLHHTNVTYLPPLPQSIHHRQYLPPPTQPQPPPPQVPPPKPRRMVPVSHQLHSTPNSIYGLPAPIPQLQPQQPAPQLMRHHREQLHHQQHLIYDSFRT